MKVILFALCVSLLVGCARPKFQMPPGTTYEDYYRTVEACGGGRSEGGFCFGPAIIVLPVVAGAAIYQHAQQKKFNECMESHGYKQIGKKEKQEKQDDDQSLEP